MASTFEALLLAQMNFALNPPMALLYQITTQSVLNSTWTSLTLDGSAADTYNGHSTSVNPSRYTAQVAGWYEVTGTACFPSNANGSRGVLIAKNGGFLVGPVTYVGTNVGDTWAAGTPGGFLVQMAVGDYVEVQGLQVSGGALSTSVGFGNVRSSMSIRWVHA